MQVTAALHEAGLESSNLILGVDFTKSNEWSGDATSVICITVPFISAVPTSKLSITFDPLHF
jgi:hypothetical protein